MTELDPQELVRLFDEVSVKTSHEAFLRLRADLAVAGDAIGNANWLLAAHALHDLADGAGKVSQSLTNHASMCSIINGQTAAEAIATVERVHGDYRELIEDRVPPVSDDLFDTFRKLLDATPDTERSRGLRAVVDEIQGRTA